MAMPIPQPQDMSPLLVTQVVQDQPLVKVYATSDLLGVASLDRILTAASIGQENLVSSPYDVRVGSLVLVPRFQNQQNQMKYRRAEVVGNEGQTIIVNLKDIGGTARCNIYDVRVIRSADLKSQLLAVPFVRTNEYILYNSLTSREWIAKELETVNKLSTLTQDCLKLQVLSVINNKPLIRVSFKNGPEDYMCFSSWLKDSGLASVVGPEMIQAAIQSKYPPQSRMSFTGSVPPGFSPMDVQPQHTIPPTSTLPYSYPTRQPIQPILPTAVSNGYAFSIRPNMPMSLPTTRMRVPRPQIVPQPAEPPKDQQHLTLTAETLPIGSKHDVYVSCVIDGAQNFTVQLKSRVETMLGKLMMALDEEPLEPYTDPLQPGTVCLGRYVKEKAVCRAIVSSILSDGANLYFVDFGNSDIVPFNGIYKMRYEFTREKMVAMRFSLADVNTDYLQTQEAEKVFKELTMEAGRPIRMEVVRPETPLKQFCKLFIDIDGKWVNVRDKMQAMMKVLQPVEYKTLPFKKGSQADVMVSYTESPARFFVQLSLNTPQLSTIMAVIKHYCATAKDKEILFPEDLSVDVPVCAMFAEDQQWYRAQVITEPDVAGNVEVLFVDYGNSETVHYSQLRAMNGEMISLAPMQAVECRLDFSPELSVRDDVIEYFSTLVLDTEFAMRVENVLPAKMLLVDLVEKAKNVAVKDDLLKRFSPPAQETISRMNSKSITPQQNNTGNWRDRKNSSGNEGNFSAFGTNNRTNSYGATDEPDNVRADFSEKRDRLVSRDGGEQSGSWKVPRREETTTPPWNNDSSNRFSEHDDRTSRNDGDSGGYRGSDSGFRSRGRDNDRPSNRDGGDRSWKRDRSGDDRGRRNDSWNTNSSKPSGGVDSWDADKKEDDWSSGGNRRGGDRDFKSSFDRGGDRKPYQKRDDSSNDWNAEKKDDNWSSGGGGGGNRRDFKSNDNWNNDDSRGGGGGGFRDSKPRNDRGGGGYREKRDFGGSGGGSSWKNDSSSGGGWKNDTSADSSWDTPKTPSREPAYDRGAVFVEPSYQPGETLEVAVSWFVNPMQFHAIPVGNIDFNALMETIQTDYARRELVDVESLTPNECLVARDKDDVIYRARFIRSIRSKKALVTFVDFGNSESVGEAWAVSQEHCAIPTQAIFCRLHGITKADENSPWSTIPDLETHFKDDKYTLTFVESVEENGSTVWLINLKNASDVDIGDLLVSSGFAVRQNVLKSEELYDYTLLKGQTIPVYPGAIESSKRFFVHIEPEQARLIQRLVLELAESQKMLPLPRESIVVGEFCLAPCDEEYFRALILSVDEKNENVHILFIDYGDETLALFSSIKILPDYLSIYNSQIAECCLYEEDGPKEEVDISKITDDDLIIKVVDVIDNKLHVLLYDVQGVRHPFPTAVEETISPLCNLPVLRVNDSVSIMHIENDKVYLQRVSDIEPLALLSNQLFEFYEKLEAAEKVALEADKVYVAKSAKFETWYRCKAVNEECKDVFYIDYGNTESAEEVLSIQPLDPQFYAAPMFCIGVSTNVHFTAKDLTPLIDTVQDFTFIATFKSVAPNEWYADLKCDSTSRTLADYAVEAACGEAVPSTEEKSTPYTAFEAWKIGEEKNVRVSHIDSPDAVHLQTVEDQPTITRLQDELQTSLTRVLPLLGAHDDLMAAQNPADEKWYRARPISKEDVFAVDFGFTLKTPRLKKLPKTFKLDESSYSVSCSLNLQPVEGAWSAEIVARLTDSVTKAENVSAKLEFVKHRVKFVDMKVDSTDVSEVISGLGVPTCPKSNEVIVSHANSLDDFYLQYCEDEDEIYALVERMKEADAWEAVAEPEADRMYAAQFVEDEQWYRAVIVKSEEDGSKQVRFVDYGNVESSTLFKALPEDLLTLPPYAVQCVQHPMPENADELNEIFTQFAPTVEGYFTAFVVSGGAPLMVMLEFKDRLINDILSEKKALLEWKLQPAEVGDKVVVSHINSPSSFYVRGETATFEAVEQALATCESVEALAEYAVDDIVAAKFPDDGLWYRAKVLEVTEEKTNVVFVDYGNQSVVEDVRALPDDAKLVACIAKHCSIRVPEGLDEWPSVASVRFSELTCEGETVFQMSIKEDGDPAIVDLHDDGLSVADELATLCKAELTAPTPEASKAQVILSHVSGVNAVWIQYQSPQLDEMIEEMANVEAFEELDAKTAEVGMLVAAEFEEMWYRAIVTKESKGDEENCKVLFIDYGNDAEATLMKRLPADLANLSPLAKCCRLKGQPVSTAEGGDASVLERLQQFVDEMKTFYVDELDESSGEPIVSLRCCDDEKTLAEIVFSADGKKDVGEIGTTDSNADGDAVVAAAEVVEPSTVDENVIVAENAQTEESAPEVAEQSIDTKTEESESCVDDSAPEAAELSTDAQTEQEDVEEAQEPSPSGNENVEHVSEALESLSIASPNFDETKVGDQLLKPSSENTIGFDDNAEDLDDGEADTNAVDEFKDDYAEATTVAENSSNFDDNVEENIGNENQLDDKTKPIADAEEPADVGAVKDIDNENEEILEEESSGTIRSVTTTVEKNAEDAVDEETPAVEDTTSSTNEKELPTNDEDDFVESAGSPVKNELDRALLEDEYDQFRTPSWKSSVDEFTTPEPFLDAASSTSEELLNTSFSVEYVLDLPEYVELFESAATDELEKCDCRVSYVTDVHDFYVQRIPADTKRIDLMERILEACVANGVLSKAESPQVGDLVAAMLDDGVWYRLKIVSASDSTATYDAVCVDHGKPCSTSEVFALPEKLSALPAFAHQCTLLMSKVPASTDQTFREIVSDCSTTYKIRLLMKDEHTTTIDLRDGSTSVTQKLMEKFLSE